MAAPSDAGPTIFAMQCFVFPKPGACIYLPLAPTRSVILARKAHSWKEVLLCEVSKWERNEGLFRPPCGCAFRRPAVLVLPPFLLAFLPCPSLLLSVLLSIPFGDGDGKGRAWTGDVDVMVAMLGRVCVGMGKLFSLKCGLCVVCMWLVSCTYSYLANMKFVNI